MSESTNTLSIGGEISTPEKVASMTNWIAKMDKQLIERMKTAIEGERGGLAIDDAHAAAIVEYVLDGYQARIDAERGKEVVAWMNERNGFICKEKTRDYHVSLFLSPPPTIPKGWALVPVEPTAEIIAAAAIAVWPIASAEDVDLARRAAKIVLLSMATAPGVTLEMLAASLATMAPAYRAMLAAAKEPK